MEELFLNSKAFSTIQYSNRYFEQAMADVLSHRSQGITVSYAGNVVYVIRIALQNCCEMFFENQW